VRNSGATAVVEGCGDHGCEYMTGGVVAVLGSTGRNFAAGMSGGIAYVLDEDATFESLCNTAMVDIESIESISASASDEDVAGDLTQHDAQRLRGMLEAHLEHTGSSVAKNILENWDQYLPKFVKVMPVEYRRALKEMQARSKAPTRDDVSVAAVGS